jgi:hypothetical protein
LCESSSRRARKARRGALDSCPALARGVDALPEFLDEEVDAIGLEPRRDEWAVLVEALLYGPDIATPARKTEGKPEAPAPGTRARAGSRCLATSGTLEAGHVHLERLGALLLEGQGEQEIADLTLAQLGW